MNPKKLLMDLEFKGEVIGKRQTYYVYENRTEFIIMTVSKSKENSFNFNTVPKGAVEYVRSSFNGRNSLTTSELTKESKKPVYIKNAFAALNILYAMCALRYAKIDHRYKGQKLYFNIKST